MIIQDLWISLKSGIVLFSYVKNEKINPDLFGAMIAALDSYAKNLSEGGLCNFDLGEMKITLLEKNNLIFIANSSKKIKIQKIEEEINKIAKRFFELYPKTYFNKVYAQTHLFNDFKNELNNM
jgi:hypothetical protein